MAKNKPKRNLWYYLREAAIMYLMVAAGMYLLQGYMLFHPNKDMHCTPAIRHWDFENILVDVDGGKTNGWYIPIENAGDVILYSHGNDGNIADWLAVAPMYRSLGFSVLLYDYGGFGNSTGKASEKRCYDDALAMWKWVTETKGIPPERIVVYGHSLGGGVAADLARQVKPGAVVLESTFTSVPDVAARRLFFLPVHWLCSYRFDNAAKVPEIHAPVMVVHSPQDNLIPFEEGKRLFELANEPKTFLEIRGGHNTGFMQSKNMLAAGLAKFLYPLLPAPPIDWQISPAAAEK